MIADRSRSEGQMFGERKKKNPPKKEKETRLKGYKQHTAGKRQGQ